MEDYIEFRLPAAVFIDGQPLTDVIASNIISAITIHNADPAAHPAIPRTVLPYVLPDEFGTDDTAAMLAAIATGKPIALARIYDITDTLPLPPDAEIHGFGNKTGLRFTPTSPRQLFDLDGADNTTLRNFKITSGNDQPTDAIKIHNSLHVSIDKVLIDGLRAGPQYSFSGAAVNISSSGVNNSQVSIGGASQIRNIAHDAVFVSGEVGNVVWIDHTVISQGDGMGVHVDSTVPQALHLDTNVIEGFYYGNIHTTPLWTSRIVGNHLENGPGTNAPCITMTGGYVKEAITIEGNNIGARDADYAIDFPGGAGTGNPTNITIARNTFSGKAGGKVFRVEFACSSIYLDQNKITASYGDENIRHLITADYAQSITIRDAIGWDIFSNGAPSVVNYPTIRLAGNVVSS